MILVATSEIACGAGQGQIINVYEKESKYMWSRFGFQGACKWQLATRHLFLTVGELVA
jgi:hypothetical protein